MTMLEALEAILKEKASGAARIDAAPWYIKKEVEKDHLRKMDKLRLVLQSFKPKESQDVQHPVRCDYGRDFCPLGSESYLRQGC